MRKRLKSTTINSTVSGRRMTKEAARIPAWNEKPGGIRLRYFWMAGNAFSKRAFFFSLFAAIAVLYIVACAGGLVRFDYWLGAFVLGCNAAFGINYYKNEALKDGLPMEDPVRRTPPMPQSPKPPPTPPPKAEQRIHVELCGKR